MHKSTHMRRRDELVFFDPKNPRSVINIVPEPIAKRLKDLWLSDDAYLLGMTERKLRGELIRRGKQPTATDSRIRLQFWLEYDRLQNDPNPNSKELEMAYVIGFAMSKEAFYTHYITDNCCLAWILCPPVEYVQALEEALRESLERVREALQADLLNRNGTLSGVFLKFLDRTDRMLYQRHAALTKGSGAGVDPISAESVGDGLPEGLEEVPGIDAEEVAREERRRKIAELRKQSESHS